MGAITVDIIQNVQSKHCRLKIVLQNSYPIHIYSTRKNTYIPCPTYSNHFHFDEKVFMAMEFPAPRVIKSHILVGGMIDMMAQVNSVDDC